jgi:hypothetical protein
VSSRERAAGGFWGFFFLNAWVNTERTKTAGGVARCGSRANGLMDRVSGSGPFR